MTDTTVKVDEDLKDLILGFLENRRKDAAALREALAREHFDSAREIGHGLKGAGGGYGFDHISELGREIEIAGRDKKAGELGRLIDELAVYLDKVKVVFVPVDE